MVRLHRYTDFSLIGNKTEVLHAEGKAKPSFLSIQLETHTHEGAETLNTTAGIKGAAGVMYCSAADTVRAQPTYLKLSLLTLVPQDIVDVVDVLHGHGAQL
jgi:hypothetical protein